MAGEYPGREDETDLRYKLRWLLEQGVTAWFDLTEAGELGLQPYAEVLADEVKKLGKQTTHIRMAIPDFSTPSSEYMANILQMLDQLLENDQVIYLHCHGGKGRTGMTVGCYLVQHGLSGEAALAQIARWRKDNPDGEKPSPETEQQTQFVVNWGK